VLIEAILGLMESMIPREKALRFLPLIAAFAFFILFSNLMALIPGLLPPTDNLNTTAALAGLAFIAYNYWGIRQQGFVKYMMHFTGPVWWLAWLMFPIEIFSHIVRPCSLALRLLGNMFGDHMVLSILLGFHLVFVPLPMMVLGLLVCVVQTLVFTLLAIVYISMAVEEHDEHEGHAEAH
jgi:F-type H+-transporting ATPase subunit a